MFTENEQQKHREIEEKFITSKNYKNLAAFWARKRINFLGRLSQRGVK